MQRDIGAAAALRRLGGRPNDWRVLRLFGDGLSVVQIAQRTGTPAQDVRELLERVVHFDLASQQA